MVIPMVGNGMLCTEKEIDMSIWELFIIAIGLSMDAFAVAVCKGLSVQKVKFRHLCTVGLYFGGFQALMPLLGYLLGYHFKDFITSIDHWIAFILLSLVGINMVRESQKQEECLNNSFSARTMFPLAIATSIDALAIGVSFAFLNVDIVPAVSFIGVTTFVLSGIGLQIGNIFGAKFKSRSELAGGVLLILMGLKILLSHLGWI